MDIEIDYCFGLYYGEHHISIYCGVFIVCNVLLPNIALNIILLSRDCLVYIIPPLTYDNDIPKYYHCIAIYYHNRTITKKYMINVIFKKNDFHIIGNSYSMGSHHSSFWGLSSKNNLYKLLVLVLNYLCSMCSLAVSTQDSPAVEPRSNPGSGKILMSENLRLYTTSPVVMC